MSFSSQELSLMANSARRLALAEIQIAGSGHPGAALGAANIISTIYANHLRFDPKNPNWAGRDRFVLSMGHASALLYAVLHLSGFNISERDLENFRTFGSITPGHPEISTPGVDVSTGPLGQGIATAVGIAMAEKIQRARGKTDGWHTFVMCSDGDLMEGIAQEAASFAGLQKLDRLIVFWDNNGISIDGVAQVVDDRLSRFAAAGWNVISVDGMSSGAIDAAIILAKKSKRPTFIACKTVIGFGSMRAGQSTVHGNPLDDADATRLIAELTENSGDELWEKLAAEKSKQNTPKVDNVLGKFDVPEIIAPAKISTRKLSGMFITEIQKKYGDKIIGATADLAGSTNVATPLNRQISAIDSDGNFIDFGVREHLMAAAMNGLNLSGFKTYCSTFLVFSDYMRPAIRMAAIMKLPSIYVFTHDSIMVGEDGATHQPIEQLAALRAIPNLDVWRPSGAAEMRAAWNAALNSTQTPTAIICSRQDFDLIKDDTAATDGAYIVAGKLSDSVAIFATGAEAATAMSVRDILAKHKVAVRVISVPSVEVARRNGAIYKLGGAHSFSIELSTKNQWFEFAAHPFGIDSFDLVGSGNARDVLRSAHLTADAIAKKILEIVGK
jgi:transketolase